ncbi:MAG TPA: DUF2892 domain-containing protein [Vicinamibacterales bacterium]|nr:DUF2892 domain-containing protein [Vicinamibacterales bacterium]
MTLEPMLRLIAGAFVLASVLLGMYVHPYFLWFTVFVGVNLVQSAFTDWCPMMTILRRAGVREGTARPGSPAPLSDSTKPRTA